MVNKPNKSPSLPGSLTPAKTVPLEMRTFAAALTDRAEAPASALPSANMTETAAFASCPVPLLPTETSWPRLLKACVAAIVSAGPINIAMPEAGTMLKAEIAS
jgi:hypothetical protein